jgi:hypothetical protein
MCRRWRIWLVMGWVLWMAKTQGGSVTWSPVREFPDRGLKDFSPRQYCEWQLEGFRVGRPDLSPRLRCLPSGVRPE